jgi:hypothetical protein
MGYQGGFQQGGFAGRGGFQGGQFAPRGGFNNQFAGAMPNIAVPPSTQIFVKNVSPPLIPFERERR